jgi:transposase
MGNKPGPDSASPTNEWRQNSEEANQEGRQSRSYRFRMAASTLRTQAKVISVRRSVAFVAALVHPKQSPPRRDTLAILFYRMLKFGQGYLDRGTEFYEQRQRGQQLQYLQKKAAQLGCK